MFVPSEGPIEITAANQYIAVLSMSQIARSPPVTPTVPSGKYDRGPCSVCFYGFSGLARTSSTYQGVVVVAGWYLAPGRANLEFGMTEDFFSVYFYLKFRLKLGPHKLSYFIV